MLPRPVLLQDKRRTTKVKVSKARNVSVEKVGVQSMDEGEYSEKRVLCEGEEDERR